MESKTSTNVAGLFVALIIVVFGSIMIQASSMFYWTDFDFNGFDNINCSLFETNIRVRRFNRTCFAFSGTSELRTEMTNDWEVEFVILYSAKGNQQFIKLPYKIPKDDLCHFADGPYTNYGTAKKISEYSDFPAPQKNVSLCTLYKAGNYTVKDLSFTSNTFVKFLQPGYYKAQLIFSNKISGESAFYAVYVRLY